MQVDSRMRAILMEAIKDCPQDFTIIWGHRGERDQNAAYASGNSTKQWPNSKHNLLPSLAVDFAPWYADPPHIRWEQVDDFGFVAGWIAKTAHEMGHEIRWGGFWSFNDCGHVELVV